MAYSMQGPGQLSGACDQISFQGYSMDNREADLSYSPAWTEQSTAADGGTSVMLRNLPNNYTRSKLLEMLDNEGFASQYNFVYLPIDFQTEASLGYAFVRSFKKDSQVSRNGEFLARKSARFDSVAHGLTLKLTLNAIDTVR
mmetsp:Transcript_10370/g.21591  ORF Transcript_10370/g.21591 Transcript_10370/m.21591 type:complete len:142 (-) Transcript_10370:296-721(-)